MKVATFLCRIASCTARRDQKAIDSISRFHVASKYSPCVLSEVWWSIPMVSPKEQKRITTPRLGAHTDFPSVIRHQSSLHARQSEGVLPVGISRTCRTPAHDCDDCDTHAHSPKRLLVQLHPPSLVTEAGLHFECRPHIVLRATTLIYVAKVTAITRMQTIISART
jgi:hypothetical protein